MSQTRWQTFFTRTQYGPVVAPSDPLDPSRSIVQLGSTGPPDLVCHEIRHYLQQRPLLRAIFPGKKIAYRPSFDPFTELRNLPRLVIYTSNVLHGEMPTAVSVEQLTVYVAVLADQTQIEDCEDGESSIASVLHEIRTALRATKARALTVWKDDRQRTMVMDLTFQASRLYRQPVVIGNAERVMELHEVPITYRMDIDKNSGELINLASA